MIVNSIVNKVLYIKISQTSSKVDTLTYCITIIGVSTHHQLWQVLMMRNNSGRSKEIQDS